MLTNVPVQEQLFRATGLCGKAGKAELPVAAPAMGALVVPNLPALWSVQYFKVLSFFHLWSSNHLTSRTRTFALALCHFTLSEGQCCETWKKPSLLEASELQIFRASAAFCYTEILQQKFIQDKFHQKGGTLILLVPG